ncbi:MAG: HTTM domain-containing protein, partial [Halobacteria archaeon]|nr:HTTM domain-containing protein [Halobacteria archaeon]
MPSPPYAFLHALSGDAWFQVLLFVVASVFALMLVVGYRTKVATVVSLVLLVSLHLRNPVILNGGDSLLRRLLFIGIFLPLGEQWSVDAFWSGD